MEFTPSASDILHLISYDHCIIVFCFISLFILMLVYFVYCFSLHVKNVSYLTHQLLNYYLAVRILSLSRCCIIASLCIGNVCVINKRPARTTLKARFIFAYSLTELQSLVKRNNQYAVFNCGQISIFFSTKCL